MPLYDPSRRLTSLTISSQRRASAFQLTPRIEEEIDFYKRRNEIGWLALECAPFKETLWAHILAKNASDPSMMYFLINQSPAVVLHANMCYNDAPREPSTNHDLDLRGLDMITSPSSID